MRRAAALLLLMAALSGCAGPPPPAPACPAGQEHVRTARLFLGRAGAGALVEATDLQRFIDQEVTPRFPDGVTVLDGGAQWTGTENLLAQQARKVVLIVLPGRGDVRGRVAAVRAAYRSRFKADPAVVLTPPACVGL